MKTNYQEQLKQTKSHINSMPWTDEAFYADFMAQTYYFVRHSTRLLARSISYFGVERDDLYSRFVSHLKEENYHEKIASNDLKFLGFNVESIEESPMTKNLWETQFYKADNTKGISLLGYILFLEAIAVHSFEDVFDTISKTYGPRGSKFIKIHIEEDPDHVDHAVALIDSLDAEEQKIVWENFNQTAETYRGMMLQSQKAAVGHVKVA